MSTDSRFANISTLDLIQELGRRSHAIVLGIAVPSANPNPAINLPQVDTTFHVGGAWFSAEGLASKLLRHAQSHTDNQVRPPAAQTPGISHPVTFTIIPPKPNQS